MTLSYVRDKIKKLQSTVKGQQDMPDTTKVGAEGNFSTYPATPVGSTHPGVLSIRELFSANHTFTRNDSILYNADTAKIVPQRTADAFAAALN